MLKLFECSCFNRPELNRLVIARNRIRCAFLYDNWLKRNCEYPPVSRVHILKKQVA